MAHQCNCIHQLPLNFCLAVHELLVDVAEPLKLRLSLLVVGLHVHIQPRTKYQSCYAIVCRMHLQAHGWSQHICAPSVPVNLIVHLHKC